MINIVHKDEAKALKSSYWLITVDELMPHQLTSLAIIASVPMYTLDVDLLLPKT